MRKDCVRIGWDKDNEEGYIHIDKMYRQLKPADKLDMLSDAVGDIDYLMNQAFKELRKANKPKED